MVLLCVSISYQRTPIGVLESFTLNDVSQALLDLRGSPGIQECAILQTCHRLELYAYGDTALQPSQLLQFISSPSGPSPDKYASIYIDDDAIRHLFRVTAGLESLVLGEKEVLYQVSSAYKLAQLTATIGPFLSTIFESAIRTAKKIHREAPISDEQLSIGDLVVKVARERLDSLQEKNFAIIGAGRIGSVIAKSITKEHIGGIIIANRTYSRAKKIAESLGGKAVHFDALVDVLAASDVVVCATAAPHKILTKDRVEAAFSRRTRPRPLLIIDVSNPRGVEPAVRSMDGVLLLDLDDLAGLVGQVGRVNEGVLRAEEIIEENLRALLERLRTLPRNSLISEFMRWADRKRWKNLKRALDTGGFNDIQRGIVLNLSYSIMRDITVPFVQLLRTQDYIKPYAEMIRSIIKEEP